jgi:protein gp37
MGRETGISWTDATFNPWWGCTKVSPGCDNCYAEAFDKRVGGAHWGKGQPRRTFGEKHWAEPLKWEHEAEKQGEQIRVFCASMADVMDDEAPAGQRERLWRLIDDTPHLTWLLLTKRPQRYCRYLPPTFAHKNVRLGITAENQAFYDVRWPFLSNAARHYFDYQLSTWVSYEPALGPLVITRGYGWPAQVICGGESGNGYRKMEQGWAEDLRAECARTGTAFFMKQMSARTPAAGAALIPAHLLVREFPA